jgi:hypothetical protein
MRQTQLQIAHDLPLRPSEKKWANRLAMALGERDRNKAHAEALAEALSEMLGAYDDMDSGNTITAFQTLEDAKAALAKWQEAQIPSEQNQH